MLLLPEPNQRAKSDLLQKLRQHTAAAHNALHGHPLLAPLQSATITQEEYFGCLRGMQAVYSILEPHYAHHHSPHDAPVLDWLEKDFTCHNITPMTITTPAIPAPICHASYLGYLYVKNGSTLGGRVISRHLHTYLRLKDHLSNHFFAGHGNETGTRWKSFMAFLSAAEIDEETCVQHAVHVFNIFKRTFDDVYEQMHGLHC